MSNKLRRIRSIIRTASYSESDSYNNDYRNSELYRKDLDYYYRD